MTTANGETLSLNLSLNGLSNGTSNGDHHHGVNGSSNGGDHNGLNGLSRINTKGRRDVCADDSGPTVKAQNLDELHSLQVKKSAPSTPRGGATPKGGQLTPKGGQLTPKGAMTPRSEEETQRQQMESIRSAAIWFPPVDLLSFLLNCSYSSSLAVRSPSPKMHPV